MCNPVLFHVSGTRPDGRRRESQGFDFTWLASEFLALDFRFVVLPSHWSTGYVTLHVDGAVDGWSYRCVGRGLNVYRFTPCPTKGEASPLPGSSLICISAVYRPPSRPNLVTTTPFLVTTASVAVK